MKQRRKLVYRYVAPFDDIFSILMIVQFHDEKGEISIGVQDPEFLFSNSEKTSGPCIMNKMFSVSH